MHIFKLAAFLPLAASLVAAAAVPTTAQTGELGNSKLPVKGTDKIPDVIKNGPDGNEPNKKNKEEEEKGKHHGHVGHKEKHHGHKGKAHKHHGHHWNTTAIEQISAQIVGHVDFDAAVGIYHNIGNQPKTCSHPPLPNSDKFGNETDVFIDLNEVLQVTVDAHNKLVSAAELTYGGITINSLAPGTVDKFAAVFVGFQQILEVILKQDGEIDASYAVQIDAFVGLLTQYIGINKATVAGVLASVQGQIADVSKRIDDCKSKDPNLKVKPVAGITEQKLLAA